MINPSFKVVSSSRVGQAAADHEKLPISESDAIAARQQALQKALSGAAPETPQAPLLAQTVVVVPPSCD